MILKISIYCTEKATCKNKILFEHRSFCKNPEHWIYHYKSIARSMYPVLDSKYSLFVESIVDSCMPRIHEIN